MVVVRVGDEKHIYLGCNLLHLVLTAFPLQIYTYDLAG